MLNTAFDWFLLMKQDLKRYADSVWIVMVSLVWYGRFWNLRYRFSQS